MPKTEEEYDTAKRLQFLEAQLQAGEPFLARHPDNKPAQVAYWRWLGEYLSLTTPGLVVTLSLPENVAWSPNLETPAQREVRAVLEGEVHRGEMSCAALAALVETVRMREEAIA